MASLNYTQSSVFGTVVAPVLADAAGDEVPSQPHGALLYTNGDAASTTITVATPGLTKYGQPEPDFTVTVAAGESKIVGPFPIDLRDPADGLVHLTYSSVTNLEVTPISI